MQCSFEIFQKLKLKAFLEFQKFQKFKKFESTSSPLKHPGFRSLKVVLTSINKANLTSFKETSETPGFRQDHSSSCKYLLIKQNDLSTDLATNRSHKVQISAPKPSLSISFSSLCFVFLWFLPAHLPRTKIEPILVWRKLNKLLIKVLYLF